MASVARYLLRAGITSGLLWVFEENRPARRFYESLGGAVLAHDGFELGGAWISEVAYGWKELGALLSRASPPPPSAR